MLKDLAEMIDIANEDSLSMVEINESKKNICIKLKEIITSCL
jgi:hypothetical protein